MDVTGEPDGPPTKSGLSLVDFSGGLVRRDLAARRRSTPRAATASAWTATSRSTTSPSRCSPTRPPGTSTRGFTPVRTRHSAHPSLVPFQAFQTKDCVDRRRLREGEVLAAARDDARAPGVGRRRALRDFAARGTQPRRADPAARGGSSCTQHVGRVARASSTPPPSRAARSTPSPGPRRAAHRRPRPDRRDRAPAVRHGQAARSRRCNVGPRRTDHRRAPQRNEDFDYVVRELLGYDDDRIGSLVAAAAFGDPSAPRTSRPSPSHGLTAMVDRTVAQRLADWVVGLRLDDVPGAGAARRAPSPARRRRASRSRPRAPEPSTRPSRSRSVSAGRPRRRCSAHRDARQRPGGRARRRRARARPRLRRHPRRRPRARDRRRAAGVVHRRPAGRRPPATSCSPRPSSATRSCAASRPRARTGSTRAACTPPRWRARSPSAAVTAKLLGARRRHHDGRARHRRAPRGRAAGVPHHRRLDQAAAPGIAPALNGMLAARLAAAGASGPATVLEGPHGIYAALSARDADLEQRRRRARLSAGRSTRITIKPYPSCQLMHVTPRRAARRCCRIPSADDVDEIMAVRPPRHAPRSCASRPRSRSSRARRTTRSSRCRGASPRWSSTARSASAPTTSTRSLRPEVVGAVAARAHVELQA